MSASHEEIQEIRAALKRIEKAIVGDEAMGHVGLVDRVGDLHLRLAVVEQERRDEVAQKRGAMWIITAVGAVAGVIGSAVTWLVSIIGN